MGEDTETSSHDFDDMQALIVSGFGLLRHSDYLLLDVADTDLALAWLDEVRPCVHSVKSLRLPRDLFYFEGHFPASPILPGVVQLDWAVRYAKEYLGLDGSFLKLEVLKFQQVLQPGDTASLNLSLNTEKGQLKFEYQSARGRHSSGAFYFAEKNA